MNAAHCIIGPNPCSPGFPHTCPVLPHKFPVFPHTFPVFPHLSLQAQEVADREADNREEMRESLLRYIEEERLKEIEDVLTGNVTLWFLRVTTHALQVTRYSTNLVHLVFLAMLTSA